MLHQFFFFAEVRLDLQLNDRFLQSVEPREWFLAPLPMIHKAIELLVSGEIEHCRYEKETALIVDSRVTG